RTGIPMRSPAGAELAARGVGAVARTPVGAARRLVGAVGSPRAAARSIQDAAEGLGEVAWELANPAPELPLNVPIGPHRRYTWVRGDLAEFKRIKSELGGAGHDVVLRGVAGAMRRQLHSRHARL